jgi:hypothetical protein
MRFYPLFSPTQFADEPKKRDTGKKENKAFAQFFHFSSRPP